MNKVKVLSTILAASMLFGTTGAMAEIEIKDFPETVNYAELVDLSHPVKTIFPGANRMKVMVGEKECSAVVYIGSENNQSQPYVLIVPDSGMTAAQVLEEGGWAAIAEEHGLVVAVMEPTGEAYDPSIEGETYAQIMATFNGYSSKYYRKAEGSNYVVAYGDAVDVATVFVESNLPGDWAGLVTFGDVEIGAADIRNEKGTELPVWMFVNELDKEAELVELFKGFNDCTDEAFANANADYIYYPDQQGNDLLLDNQPMSQVRVTVTEDAAALDADRAAVAYDFLSVGTRNNGFGNAKMGHRRTLTEWDATYEHIDVDGISRYWVQYVPTALRGATDMKAPLMVVTHGGSLNGIYFAERTQLIRLAEERNFIVVFPTGSVNINGARAGITPTWNNMRSAEQWDDVKFISMMVESLKENLPVDGSRVYMYGHSMGCLMSFAMSYYTDIFAASAGSGAASIPYSAEALEGSCMTPRYIILGENDMDDPNLETGEKIQTLLKDFIAYNDASALEDASAAFKTGRLHNYIWNNEEGAPVVRYTMVEDMGHTSTLDLLNGVYDWMSQFSRNENGEIVYGGGIE